jgi:hypothetical protein
MYTIHQDKFRVSLRGLTTTKTTTRTGALKDAVVLQVSDKRLPGSLELNIRGNQKVIIAYDPLQNTFVVYDRDAGPVADIVLWDLDIETTSNSPMYVKIDVVPALKETNHMSVALCYLAKTREGMVSINVTKNPVFYKQSGTFKHMMCSPNSNELGPVHHVGNFTAGDVVPFKLQPPVPSAPPSPTPLNRADYIQKHLVHLMQVHLPTDPVDFGSAMAAALRYLKTDGVLDNNGITSPVDFAVLIDNTMVGMTTNFQRLAALMEVFNDSSFVDYIKMAIRQVYTNPDVDITGLADAIENFLLVATTRMDFDLTDAGDLAILDQLVNYGTGNDGMFALMFATTLFRLFADTHLAVGDPWRCAVLSLLNHELDNFQEFVGEMASAMTMVDDKIGFTDFISRLHESHDGVRCSEMWHPTMFTRVVAIYKRSRLLSTNMPTQTKILFYRLIMNLTVRNLVVPMSTCDMMDFTDMLFELDARQLLRVVTHVYNVVAVSNMDIAMSVIDLIARTFVSASTIPDVYEQFWTTILDELETVKLLGETVDIIDQLLFGRSPIDENPLPATIMKVFTAFNKLDENGFFYKMIDDTDRWQMPFMTLIAKNTTTTLSAFFAMPDIIDMFATTTDLTSPAAYPAADAMVSLIEPILSLYIPSTEMVNDVTALLLGTEPPAPPVVEPQTPTEDFPEDFFPVPPVVEPQTPTEDFPEDFFPVPPNAPARRVRFDFDTDSDGEPLPYPEPVPYAASSDNDSDDDIPDLESDDSDDDE